MSSDRFQTETGEIIARVLAAPAVQSAVRRVESGGALSGAGVSLSAQPFLAALLHRQFPRRTILVVTDNLKRQESVQQDLETWLGAARPLFYPAWDILPHEDKLPHADVISERLATLVALGQLTGKEAAPVIVTSVTALLQRTFPPNTLGARTRTLRRGDKCNPLDLIEWLEEQGYEPEAQVTQKGEIALRGGIVDVYPLPSPWPVRLEFFGDELESLRQFDPQTQISREEITAIDLPPAGELGLLKRARHVESPEPPGELATLADHLPADTIVLLCEPALLTEHADAYEAQAPAQDPFFIPWAELRHQLQARGAALVDVEEGGEFPPPEMLVSEAAPGAAADLGGEAAMFASLELYRPLGQRAPEPQVAEVQRREFFLQLHRWQRQGHAVHVFCNNDGERQRFGEIWQEMGLDRADGADATRLKTHIGSLARGFLCAEAKTVVVTDAEIFGRYKIQRARQLKSPHAAATRSALDIDFAELEEGDYVVHLQHGIGRYAGLKVLPVTVRKGEPPAETGQECIVIEYAATEPGQTPPRLYVPVTEAHLVSKYVGAGKIRPQLNTLGGKRWEKTKEQAERAVRDLASELLAIQAKRAAQPGYAFGPDTAWQREFESAFIYEETIDQLRAIQEAKRDLEVAKPMDRLVCGDVGFGKTEVAIRAAFKAVMGGKQVAMLVPTTVLAQQHYNTLRERMADYPVRVELLSRFRTRREQAKVIADLATGGVDIIVGTHRLVQDDVHFKDLGLVVIDEEQRFGVLHKEKFKLLRTHVDVLTLSATPIPRTLYLALTGARDMSTIQTPPQDRLPVETIVAQYDERIMRDAILREMNRGGQVFFLHNRVLTIDTMQQKLQALVPDARIVVGHGQMHADDLEEVMTAFVNGEADILLSTSIIESGLDIPNANTIIIDRADRFGLSELYQLRGRVGRYKHQAYAYLMLPRHARLLTDVRKRMSAIKQYAQLGSGFKIAMRDLEIRGAGNLLGSQQSGHITAVGFELYCNLLKRSVASLKGEKVKPRIEVQVRLDFLHIGLETVEAATVGLAEAAAASGERPKGKASAHLPPAYIAEPQHRIDIYRRLAQAEDKSALEAVRAAMRDRFGPLPGPVELLLLLTELKVLASDRSITVIETREDRLMLTRNNDYVMLGGKFPRLGKKTPEARLKEIKKLLLAL